MNQCAPPDPPDRIPATGVPEEITSSPTPADRHAARLAINATWLVMLRWAAVVGQLITIAVVVLVLGVKLRVGPLLAIVAITAVTNLGLYGWLAHGLRTSLFRMRHGQGDLILALVMMFDIAALTALLYFAGGPENPFAIFYLVNLTLAAVVLAPWWAWAITALTIGCFGLLFFVHEPLPLVEGAALGTAEAGSAVGWPVPLPLVGFFAAFVTCALVIVYFITRVTVELERREAQLREAEQQRAHGEKLEALATLAAGAAHELASPLSTIAIASKELEYEAATSESLQNVAEDIRLIRAEVDRCRAILVRMSADAGQAVGETWRRLSAAELMEATLSAMKGRERVGVRHDHGAAACRLHVPAESLAQALRGIIQNALDASPPETTVEVTIHATEGRYLTIAVRDRGPGMSDEVLRRAGEPFFTTKQPGQGMGLGLFLARRVVERLGGRVRVASQPGEGSTVEIRVPLESRSTSKPSARSPAS